MDKSLINTASRTIINIFVLGLIAAGTIFTASLLKASGEKMIGSLTADVNAIRKEAFSTKKAA